MNPLRFDLSKFAVRQRHDNTGCVPTGYEMLLKHAGAKGIEYSDFQERFDLDRTLPMGASPRNNFDTVAGAVMAIYAQVVFRRKIFPKDKGLEKFQFLEQRLAQGALTLLSLWQGDDKADAWHTMPVVGGEPGKLLVVERFDEKGNPTIVWKDRDFVIERHRDHSGGDDVAWLERC